MATALSRLPLLQPRTLAEALRLLRDEGPLVPLAGCTDLYVGLHFGTVPEPRFLDLQGLRALRGIRLSGQTLVIGALATYAELIASPLVRRRLPILAEASRWVGSPQIQNRGTLGGNVANASPAGDTLPVLAVAEASVVLRSVRGERRVSFASFCTGYRQTAMRPDELIVAIEVPPVEGRQWFRKVGTRAAQAISKVVMAAVRAPRPRIALGSVAPTVVRAPRTEALLAGGGTSRRGAGRPVGRDPADRRPALDGRLPPPRLRQPARAVLERHRTARPGTATRAAVTRRRAGFTLRIMNKTRRRPQPMSGVSALADRPMPTKGNLLLRTLAMPADTNANGDIFGGWIMSQMDIAGGILAKETAHSRVVTVAVDSIRFLKPVKVGDVICCYGRVLRIGTTSIAIELEVWVKQVRRETEEEWPRFKVTEALFTYVAIDGKGRKRAIKVAPTA